MSEHIPAWKRIGLSVKKDLKKDRLAITTTVDPANLPAKQLKKLKRSRDDVEDEMDINNNTKNMTKKGPKRPKLPKDKKPPPPEKDQLVYLRQYTEDRDNWKFAKSKQNWILKNLFKIESKYDIFLQNYVKELQGGSKDRLVVEMKEIISKWNKITEEMELKMLKKLEEEEEEEEDKSKKDESTESPPEYDNVIKARDLVLAMTGESLELKGVEELELALALDRESDTEEPIFEEDDKLEQEIQGKDVEVETSNKVDNDDDIQKEGDEDQTNLIIEEVEVTDFVTPEDFEDPVVSKEEELKEDNVTVTKDEKKDKKEKKKSKHDKKKHNKHAEEKKTEKTDKIHKKDKKEKKHKKNDK